MRDMEKLCSVIEEELQKIAEKGLNTGNLETAYKLIDMYKDLKNTEYWEMKGEYYMGMMDGGYSEADGGYSSGNYSERGRKRDSMGRYSRESGNSYNNGSSYARRGGYSNRGYSREGGGYSERGYSGNDRYDEYMDSKQSYRSSGKSPECKQRLMDTLEDYMDDFSQKMEEMLRDSDCAEERTTIKRYIDQLKNLV